MPDNQHLRLRGQRLTSASQRKPEVADKGRTCKADNCTTVLSVYNTSPLCWYHAPFKVPRLRGRKQ